MTAAAVGLWAILAGTAPFAWAGAAPSALGFAGFGFEEGLALGGGAALAVGRRPERTGLAFAMMTADPGVIGTLVTRAIEAGCWKLAGHGGSVGGGASSETMDKHDVQCGEEQRAVGEWDVGEQP